MNTDLRIKLVRYALANADGLAECLLDTDEHRTDSVDELAESLEEEARAMLQDLGAID